MIFRCIPSIYQNNLFNLPNSTSLSIGTHLEFFFVSGTDGDGMNCISSWMEILHVANAHPHPYCSTTVASLFDSTRLILLYEDYPTNGNTTPPVDWSEECIITSRYLLRHTHPGGVWDFSPYKCRQIDEIRDGDLMIGLCISQDAAKVRRNSRENHPLEQQWTIMSS